MTSPRHDSQPSPGSAPVLTDCGTGATAEASVRQLIAAGNDKTALKRAKEIHRTQATAATEALLVEAYAARISALMRQNLIVEAQGLLDVVRHRYPSARSGLDELSTRALLRAGALDEAVAPLADPVLGAERRAAIDRVVQQELGNIGALAACQALAADHPLRRAAVALDRAFAAVTSGPVADEALALPEVSHRSPLAPWKLLVRAIAGFYRGDEESCRRALDAVPPDSAPARVVPAVRAALRRDTAVPLSPAARALVSGITGDPAELRRALEALDRAFASNAPPNRVLKAIRAAVQECRQRSPDHLERLKQHVSVRAAMAGIEKDQVLAALGGPSRHDAYFMRLFARGMEETGQAENLVLACGLWAEFRQLAAQEGWFAANGIEVAALYLHMAGLLERVPGDLLRAFQQPARWRHEPAGQDLYFQSPETLYQRACALDPHAGAFSAWMAWAKQQSAAQADRVAEAWHKHRPRDLAPVLHLMESAERRRAFPAALSYLAKAEQIDGVHAAVRGARLRLLAGRVLRHVQQRKLTQADEDLREMAALPQARHGDRPALVAALRGVASLVRGSREDATACRAELERLLDSRAAAALLFSCVAGASKQAAAAGGESVEQIAEADRATVPAAVARVAALTADVGVRLDVASPWVAEAARQFPRCRASLDAGQLLRLADAALSARHLDLAYAVSAAGLALGGATEAAFLLLRARSLPEDQLDRRAVCAAAAADLARRQRDTELAAQAAALARELALFGDLSLTPEQADEVFRKERAEPASVRKRRRAPDYSALFVSPCQCPRCRRARGEAVDPFDDLAADGEGLDDEVLEGTDLPPDMPPEVARALYEETRKAVLRGESFEDFLSRLVSSELPGRRRPRRKRTKGRRR